MAIAAGASMTINRRKLLETRLKCKALLASPDFSDETRALAKKALDQADAALGLDDALRRKAIRESPHPEIERLRQKLGDWKQEVVNLTVMGLEPNLSPKNRKIIRDMEQTARKQAKLTRLALEHMQEQQGATPPRV
jgi:hypothetical protein